jgi:hypothetical protein
MSWVASYIAPIGVTLKEGVDKPADCRGSPPEGFFRKQKASQENTGRETLNQRVHGSSPCAPTIEIK